MTVAELIEHLKTLPQDMLVTCDDYAEMPVVLVATDVHVSVEYYRTLNGEWLQDRVVHIEGDFSNAT